MGRRYFTRECKLETVRLIKDRGVTVARAARDLGIHSVLREGVDMKFGLIAKHRPIWPVSWMCAALGVRARASTPG